LLVRDEQELCLLLLIKRVIWLQSLFTEAEWGGEFMGMPFEAFPISLAHNIEP
jgi:hypothetical protein